MERRGERCKHQPSGILRRAEHHALVGFTHRSCPQRRPSYTGDQLRSSEVDQASSAASPCSTAPSLSCPSFAPVCPFRIRLPGCGGSGFRSRGVSGRMPRSPRRLLRGRCSRREAQESTPSYSERDSGTPSQAERIEPTTSASRGVLSDRRCFRQQGLPDRARSTTPSRRRSRRSAATRTPQRQPLAAPASSGSPTPSRCPSNTRISCEARTTQGWSAPLIAFHSAPTAPRQLHPVVRLRPSLERRRT